MVMAAAANDTYLPPVWYEVRADMDEFWYGMKHAPSLKAAREYVRMWWTAHAEMKAALEKWDYGKGDPEEESAEIASLVENLQSMTALEVWSHFVDNSLQDAIVASLEVYKITQPADWNRPFAQEWIERHREAPPPDG